MTAILTALGTMIAIALAGWVLGRTEALGRDAVTVLARTVFTVATPALLLVTVAHADLHVLLSRAALVTALSSGAVAVLAAVLLRLALRRPPREATVGALAASYVNSTNLGLPLAVYLLGDPVAVVPVLLFQLLVLGPVAITVLGAPGPGASGGVGSALRRTSRNPIMVATVVGLVLSALPVTVPEVVFEPLALLGAAAPPLALITFGMSLSRPGSSPERSRRSDLAVVLALRGVVHPVLALVVGRAFGMDGAALLAVVTMAGLPTGQNVLVYAMQYGRGTALARDAGLLTTLLAVPGLLVITAVLG